MAVQQGYGKSAGANSLVFAYDTTDTRNSFKGRPTVNQFLHHGTTGRGSAADNLVNFPVQGTTGFKRLGYGQTFGDYTIKPEDVVYMYDKVDVNGCHYHGNVASIPQGVYLVFSVDYYLSPGLTIVNGSLGNVENYGTNALSGGLPGVNQSTQQGVWHRIVQVMGPRTATGTGSQAMFLYPGGCGSRLSSTPGYILYKNPQVEFVNVTTASPFVQGTRSNEQSILDLTGNSEISVSDVSFNSAGEMVFDGSNDKIHGISLKHDHLDSSAIEFVVTPETKNIRMTVGGYRHNAGYSSPTIGMIYIDTDNRFKASVITAAEVYRYVESTTRVAPNQTYHVVLNKDTTTGLMQLFVNGVLENSATFDAATYAQWSSAGSYIGSDNFDIGKSYNTDSGQGWGADFLQGTISVCKVYNKTLTSTEVASNYKVYRKRFVGLDNYYDNTTDGGRWIRFWWYTGVGWPGHETEAFGHDFGTFDSSSHYGFQKLPAGLTKDNVELLAKDNSGNIYKWDFAANNTTALRAWNSMTAGTQGSWAQEDVWNPTVLAGTFHNVGQDSWKYRVSEGVASFLLDDDGCDCYSTLNAGHAMCGGSWNQTYAQPDGAYLRYGVDLLNDNGCKGPVPERSLELFYRLK